MGNLQLHSTSGIGLDQIDEIPRNTARRNSSQESIQRTPGRDTTQQTPDGSTRPDVDGMHPQHRIRAIRVLLRFDLQINIVDSDDFPSVDIDHLLIEQITLQQKQAFRAVDRTPFPREEVVARMPPLIADTAENGSTRFPTSSSR